MILRGLKNMAMDRCERIEELFHAAVGMDARQRGAFLAQACQGDARLQAEVESLLAAAEKTAEFLEQPASPSLAQAAAGSGSGSWDDSSVLPPGKRVGAWQLTKKLAVGGMGTVYLASRADGQYEKQVAIKLIRLGSEGTEQAARGRALRRFREELQNHANLDHPNIAKLLDGGTTSNGVPYLVMEHIDGLPIDKYCEAHKLSIKNRLRLFRTVCLAVQHAHNRLIAHCDLKPNNVLVTSGPEPDREPMPKLVDFSIARLLEREGADAPQAPAKTAWALTPQYASPEQVSGEPLSAASDIYSLGVVLYELVSGHLPYKVTTYDAKRIIRTQAPPRPSSVNPLIDRELDAIILKVLEKDPAHRYSSAAALAEDIERYLTGRPIAAHPDSAWYGLRKFLLRRWSQIVWAVFIAALVASGVAIGVWYEKEAQNTEREFADAEWSRTLSQWDAMGRRRYAEAVALESAGQASDALIRYFDAQLCFEAVLNMEQAAPPNHEPRSEWINAETKRVLARCLTKLQRYDEAEALLLESYAVLRAHFGLDAPRVRETRRWLAELYEAWNKPDKAAKYRTG